MFARFTSIGLHPRLPISSKPGCLLLGLVLGQFPFAGFLATVSRRRVLLGFLGTFLTMFLACIYHFGELFGSAERRRSVESIRPQTVVVND